MRIMMMVMMVMVMVMMKKWFIVAIRRTSSA